MSQHGDHTVRLFTVVCALGVLLATAGCVTNQRPADESAETSEETPSQDTQGDEAVADDTALPTEETSGAAAVKNEEEDAASDVDGDAMTHAEDAQQAEAAEDEMHEGSRTVQIFSQGTAGVSGTVHVSEFNMDQTRITINLPEELPTKVRLANVYEGTCATLGPARLALNNVVGGSSTTIINVPYSTLTKGGSLAIRVTGSTGGTVTAGCGQIVN